MKGNINSIAINVTTRLNLKTELRNIMLIVHAWRFSLKTWREYSYIVKKTHAFFFLLILGVIGVAFLTKINSGERSASSTQDITAWGGSGESFLSYDELAAFGIREASDEPGEIMIPPLFSKKAPSSGTSLNNQENTENDFNAFQMALNTSFPSQSGNSGDTANEPSFFVNAYNFIPQGFIKSSISQLPPQNRTSEQKVLFDYGNAVGIEIQAFDTSHTDTTKILDAFFKDYMNPNKISPLLTLARDYERFAGDLSTIKNIPSEVSKMHTDLSASYATLSQSFAKLTEAKTDKEIVDAIARYNTSAEKVIKNFIALADLFSSRGVKFAENDPGYIFQFNR